MYSFLRSSVSFFIFESFFIVAFLKVSLAIVYIFTMFCITGFLESFMLPKKDEIIPVSSDAAIFNATPSKSVSNLCFSFNSSDIKALTRISSEGLLATSGSFSRCSNMLIDLFISFNVLRPDLPDRIASSAL